MVAALAQLVERWIVAPKVTGSRPVCRPKYHARTKRQPEGWRFVFVSHRASEACAKMPLTSGGCVGDRKPGGFVDLRIVHLIEPA